MVNLDSTGSNITSFSHLFSDGTGRKFRNAIASSFSFASGVVRVIQDSSVNHQLELWDQAVSYELGTTLKSESFLAEGVKTYLEKQESEEVWHYGFPILERDRNQKTRQWVLPDGLLKKNDQIITIEFDHGKVIGKWASQLLKAIRALAAMKIDGVIYCYCFDSESSIKKLSTDQLTVEFKALVDCNSFGKPIGIITIFSDELQVDLPNRNDVIDFLNSAYINNPSKAKESRKKAEDIAKTLANN
ncbi:MAG: hypothetical protein WCE68_13795 [Anaerolineales bacterium]